MVFQHYTDVKTIERDQLKGAAGDLLFCIVNYAPDSEATKTTLRLLYEDVWCYCVKPYFDNGKPTTELEDCYKEAIGKISSFAKPPQKGIITIDEACLKHFASTAISELKLVPEVNEMIRKVMLGIFTIAAGSMSPNLVDYATAHCWTQRICGDICATSCFENEGKYKQLLDEHGFGLLESRLLDADDFCIETAKRYNDAFHKAITDEEWWKDDDPHTFISGHKRFAEYLSQVEDHEETSRKDLPGTPMSESAKTAAAIHADAAKLRTLAEYANEGYSNFTSNKHISNLVVANFLMRFLREEISKIEWNFGDFYRKLDIPNLCPTDACIVIMAQQEFSRLKRSYLGNLRTDSAFEFKFDTLHS